MEQLVGKGEARDHNEAGTELFLVGVLVNVALRLVDGLELLILFALVDIRPGEAFSFDNGVDDDMGEDLDAQVARHTHEEVLDSSDLLGR